MCAQYRTSAFGGSRIAEPLYSCLKKKKFVVSYTYHKFGSGTGTAKRKNGGTRFENLKRAQPQNLICIGLLKARVTVQRLC